MRLEVPCRGTEARKVGEIPLPGGQKNQSIKGWYMYDLTPKEF